MGDRERKSSSLLGLMVVTRFHGGLPQLVIAVIRVPSLVLLANTYHAFVRRYPWLAPAPSAVRWTLHPAPTELGGKYMIMHNWRAWDLPEPA